MFITIYYFNNNTNRTNKNIFCIFLDSLLNYFSQFGEVCDCVVMKNPQTGKSRGFGFVTFKDPNCVDTVLSTQHSIDGRQVGVESNKVNGSF